MKSSETVGSLFSGIGGFDLGFERAGFRIAWQSETDKKCCEVLERHFPGVPNLGPIEDIRSAPEPVHIIAGGDPCPIRSRARGNRRSLSPDLSGYFLALIGKGRPRWVVRENVPAPDRQDFAAALILLGYRAGIVTLDSADFLPQNRTREFIVGCSLDGPAERFFNAVSEFDITPEIVNTVHSQKATSVSCLLAHPQRLATEDSYILEPAGALRILSAVERERLQGFPDGWTAPYSRRVRGRMTGNAVTVPVAEWIATNIRKAEA